MFEVNYFIWGIWFKLYALQLQLYWFINLQYTIHASSIFLISNLRLQLHLYC